MNSLQCVEGRILRHDPQSDDPYLQTDIGSCPDCYGLGCSEENSEKYGKAYFWLVSRADDGRSSEG